MSSVDFVERASWLSRELTRFRSRGPGDTENAMRGLERDYAIDYWVIWRLRYRAHQVKDVGVTVFARLEAAYRAECERQHRKLEHEIAITRALVGTDSKTVAEVEAYLDETESG